MAQATPRIAYDNYARRSAAVVSAGSERQGYPASWITDQIRSKAWESKTGWNVSVNFNDTIDALEGGVKRAGFITAGNYATGDDYALAVQGAINNSGLWPLELSPTAWYRADSLLSTIANGGSVSQWSDVSGNNRHLTQATGALQPVLVWDVLNGRPVVRFDGARELSSSAALSALLDANGYGTVFAVVKVDVDQSGIDVIFSDTGTQAALYHNGGQLNALNTDGGGPDVTVQAQLTGIYQTAIWGHDATNVYAGLSDADTAALMSAASGTTSTLAGTLDVGHLSSTNHFKGDIAELIFFNSFLSEENRRRIQRYLVQKYNLIDSTTAPSFTNTYSVSYSGTTKAFSFSAGANFQLLFSTGANVASGPARDLGFTAADTAAATSASGSAVYGSRNFVDIDLGSALAVTRGAIISHNISTDGTVKLQGHSVSMMGQGAGATGSTSQTLTGNTSIRISDFATQTYRYWRILIDDTTNDDGYAQVGYAYVGGYDEFADGYSVELPYSQEQLSTIHFSDQGAHKVDERQERKTWLLSFPVVSDAVSDQFKAMQSSVLVGKTFLVSLDPVSDMTKTYYVYLPERIQFDHVQTTQGSRWNITVTIHEALG